MHEMRSIDPNARWLHNGARGGRGLWPQMCTWMGMVWDVREHLKELQYETGSGC
jgi:hypothetical protein